MVLLWMLLVLPLALTASRCRAFPKCQLQFLAGWRSRSRHDLASHLRSQCGWVNVSADALVLWPEQTCINALLLRVQSMHIVVCWVSVV